LKWFFFQSSGRDLEKKLHVGRGYGGKSNKEAPSDQYDGYIPAVKRSRTGQVATQFQIAKTLRFGDHYYVSHNQHAL